MYSILVLTTHKSLEPPAVLGRYCNFLPVASSRIAMDSILKRKPDLIISHFAETSAEYLRLAVRLHTLHIAIAQFVCCAEAYHDIHIAAENLGIEALHSHQYDDDISVEAILRHFGLPAPVTKKEGGLMSAPSLIGSEDA